MQDWPLATLGLLAIVAVADMNGRQGTRVNARRSVQSARALIGMNQNGNVRREISR